MAQNNVQRIKRRHQLIFQHISWQTSRLPSCKLWARTDKNGEISLQILQPKNNSVQHLLKYVRRSYPPPNEGYWNRLHEHEESLLHLISRLHPYRIMVIHKILSWQVAFFATANVHIFTVRAKFICIFLIIIIQVIRVAFLEQQRIRAIEFHSSDLHDMAIPSKPWRQTEPFNKEKEIARKNVYKPGCFVSMLTNWMSMTKKM